MDEKRSLSEVEISIESLATEPYNHVIAYPRPEPEIVRDRIEQLNCLGINTITFTGLSNINGSPVLGKGCVGIVVEARMGNGEKRAIKIRRTDANRPDMMMEAKFLKSANEVQVGPELYDQTDDVLLMELVRGQTLPCWAVRDLDYQKARKTIRHLLEQCYVLDKIGLDHGELNHAHKNVLIAGEESFIVDFESSSTLRRPKNLTSIIQYLFCSGGFSRTIREAVKLDIERDQLIEQLQSYKARVDATRYADLVLSLGL